MKACPLKLYKIEDLLEEHDIKVDNISQVGFELHHIAQDIGEPVGFITEGMFIQAKYFTLRTLFRALNTDLFLTEENHGK
jgi:hypothetical protein